jgi:cyclophilin family peptidyl-prolyl cis-trans isomerase/HEAT repeat protein
MTTPRLFVCATLVAVLSMAEADGAGPTSAERHRRDGPASMAVLRHALIVAEDARPATRAEAAPLLAALAQSSPVVVRQAVRALGRLERAEFLPDVAAAFGHADPRVRAEAANAIAQMAAGNPDGAATALRARFGVERDPVALGALCGAIGRLPYASREAGTTVEHLLAQALADPRSATVVRLGAARGLESLQRRRRNPPYRVQRETVEVLQAAALAPDRGVDEDTTRVRRVAVMVLKTAGAADFTFGRLVADGDEQIRRLAVSAAAGNVSPALREQLVQAGLADAAWSVRMEAVRAHASVLGATDCGLERAALDDASAHVRLLAIDRLATACPGDAAATAALRSVVTRGGSWHAPAHAIFSLAQRSPMDAQPLLERFVTSPEWHSRVYAARVAQIFGDAETLGALAADPSPNVRAEAITLLAAVAKHEADSVYRRALASRDSPVVMAAAAALEGTPDAAAASAALLDALAALSNPHRDTSRDPRLAVLTRLGETGCPAVADALTPYLADADPAIAAHVAGILRKWTGVTHQPRTTRIQTLPAPTAEEIAALPAGVRVTMASGRSFEIRFFTEVTPVSVWRVVRLVRQTYYDGLTWHRVIPNFIIQGGSPGADEYVGDGPFMRDELGLISHVRGTVGISTRGRDTGDAQLFINLVDTPRFDHDYTVIGEVVSGMDVVDGILEGDVMERVTTVDVRPRDPGQRP